MKHKAKKYYGQNFLTDTNLIKKIVLEANVKDKNVIEVGPGMGALTKFLAPTAKKLVALEIDHDLKPHLDLLAQENSNLEVIYEDFLKSDLDRLWEQKFNREPVVLVGNLPYYITTPILFKALEKPWISDIVIMIQKEVAARLIAKSNQKEYNALSIMIQYQASVTKVVDVSRKMFQPQPNVDSIVVKISKFSTPIIDKQNEALFIEIVKASFRQKRKTIVNNWFSMFEVEKVVLEEFLSNLNYNPSIRAEQLSIEDFVLITSNWKWSKRKEMYYD